MQLVTFNDHLSGLESDTFEILLLTAEDGAAWGHIPHHDTPSQLRHEGVQHALDQGVISGFSRLLKGRERLDTHRESRHKSRLNTRKLRDQGWEAGGRPGRKRKHDITFVFSYILDTVCGTVFKMCGATYANYQSSLTFGRQVPELHQK